MALIELNLGKGADDVEDAVSRAETAAERAERAAARIELADENRRGHRRSRGPWYLVGGAVIAGSLAFVFSLARRRSETVEVEIEPRVGE